MDPDLLAHRPNEEARRRAEADGIDLEALKRDDPERYRMLSAGEVLRAHPELDALAGSALAALVPERRLYRVDGGGWVRLLAFPPLDAAEQERVDGLLARLPERPEWRARHAYYREVHDVRGRRRELGLPSAPDAYAGGDALVGPFPDEAAADAWARGAVAPPRTHDTLHHAGGWFCDVFVGDG